MARTDIETCLCLDEFAKYAGLTPPHFNGVSYEPAAWASCDRCNTYFFQYPWQNSHYISRQEVAQAISEAEDTIENYLDGPLCPEQRCVTFDYRSVCDAARVKCNPFYQGGTVGGYHLPDCPVYFWGDRVLDELATATVDYQIEQYLCEANGITYDVPVLACVTVPLDGYDPGVVEECEIRLYIAGECGERTQEICPLKTVSIIPNVPDGGGDPPFPEFTLGVDVLQVCVDPWLLIKPELLEEWPTLGSKTLDGKACNLCVIDGKDIDSYVTELCVAREWYDDTVPSVEFIWQPKTYCNCQGNGCDVCTPRIEPGCLVGDIAPDCQKVFVQPAEWNEVDQTWCGTSWGDCGPPPDFVRIKYWTAIGDKKCDKGPCDSQFPMPALKKIIAELAQANIDRALCGCSCEFEDKRQGRHASWLRSQEDASISSNTSSRFVPKEMINNPLGMKVGQIEVWKKLALFKKRYCKSKPGIVVI